MQNHFKTKEKHKKAKDKTSTGQDVDKTGRTTKKKRKEGGKQAEYFSASPKERGEREKAGGAVQKERGANKGNIFVQPPKKGRRIGREKRRAQIENEDEQREPRKTI